MNRTALLDESWDDAPTLPNAIPPTEPPGPGASLVVDVVAGEPVSTRRDSMARLIALANTHDPALADAVFNSRRRTTVGGRQITLPPPDEVLDRLADDTEPVLSSDRLWPVDDPNDNDDPDDFAEAAERR